jgi:hypothetical protein
LKNIETVNIKSDLDQKDLFNFGIHYQNQSDMMILNGF